jgi:SnoaL-like domain
VTATVDSIFDEYARRYTERDIEGVTNLCLSPFVAIRRGEAIHMADRDAVRDHFASAIEAYRLASGTAKWTPVEIDTRQLGKHAVFATVHWNALDADGQVVRDTWTSYQLLATPEGWRFLSYTNHF